MLVPLHTILWVYTCTLIFVIHVHVHVLKAPESGERKVNGQSSEQTSTAAPTTKPHPPEGVDQALLKTPPKRATGIILACTYDIM